MEPPARVTNAQLMQLLRRAGYPADVIEEIGAQAPELMEADRAWQLLEQHGLSRGKLMERMGASP